MLPTIRLLTSEALPANAALPLQEPGAGLSGPAGEFLALLEAMPAIESETAAGNGLPEFGSLLPAAPVVQDLLPNSDAAMEAAMDAAMPAPATTPRDGEGQVVEPLFAAASRHGPLPAIEIGPPGPDLRESEPLPREAAEIRRPGAVTRRAAGTVLTLPDAPGREGAGKEPRAPALPANGLVAATDERGTPVLRSDIHRYPQAAIRPPESVDLSAPHPDPVNERGHSLRIPESILPPVATGLPDGRTTTWRDDVWMSAKHASSHVPPAGSPFSDPAPLSATSTRIVPDVAAPAPRHPVGLEIALAVQEPGWGKEVAERVLLMANSRLQNAEIRLSPAELGPLRVQLAIDDGLANVSFQAQHAVTREAIELALPRLRDMLAESGLSLGQASVNDDGVRREARDGAARSHFDVHEIDGESGLDESAGDSIAARTGAGLVDTYV